MPVIQLKTNCSLSKEQIPVLLTDIRNVVAELLHKDIHNVMVTFSQEDILMGESFEPAFYADIRYISPDAEVKDKDYICNEVLSVIQKHTNVNPERVMIFIGTVSINNAWKYVKK